ncbi:hypothetical protein BR1R3_50630 [Pseudomonas atacamensis]|nr:hypothetical protein BR1R3_50630 [Pseudomonas atacamensis]
MYFLSISTVRFIFNVHSNRYDWTLRNTDVGEVLGIGKRMKAHLETMGIKTAMDLAKADPWMLRQKFSVVIEKTAREEAVATYTQRAAEKLRAQNSLCKKIRVTIRTGMLNPEEAKYANGGLVELPYPTKGARVMTKAATEVVNRLFRSGLR